MRKFSIYSGGTVVGQAEVETKGLYHYIKCGCRFDKDGIYKIMIAGEVGTIMLGTCIPKDNGYFLEKKVSVRSVGDGELSLCAVGEGRGDEQITCISEDRAFVWIDRLEDCVLINQAGRLKVRLIKKGSTPQGNDPTLEHGDGSRHQ